MLTNLQSETQRESWERWFLNHLSALHTLGYHEEQPNIWCPKCSSKLRKEGDV